MSEPRFKLRKVDMTTWAWELVEDGEVLALSPKGYESEEEAQIAIAKLKMGAREAETPEV